MSYTKCNARYCRAIDLFLEMVYEKKILYCSMNKSIVIVIIVTACICMVMSSSMGGFGVFLLQSLQGTGPVHTIDAGESVTYDNIPRAGDGCVVLYEHADGGGDTYELCLDGESIVSTKNLKDHRMNDKASALDVGKGVSVKLYPDANLSGTPRTFDQQKFYSFSDSGMKHDIVSSLAIRKK